MSRWQDIATAPYDQEVEVRVNGRPIRAILLEGVSMTEDGEPCDQWQATTDRYPRCWSDGACWESNADGCCSAQPSGWREIELKRDPGMAALVANAKRKPGAPVITLKLGKQP